MQQGTSGDGEVHGGLRIGYVELPKQLAFGVVYRYDHDHEKLVVD